MWGEMNGWGEMNASLTEGGLNWIRDETIWGEML